MSRSMLGVPEVATVFCGIDVLGKGCRVDESVSVMRFGNREQVIRLANDVSIYANTRLVVGDVQAHPDVGIRIGARTIVNVGGYLSGEGGLDIGEDVLIGPHVKLLSAGHAIDEGDMVIARNRITRSRIVVGDGAWIGAGAIVLEGVTIGQGAVVAAGALVRSDVPAGMVAAGLPATIRRARRLAPDLNGVGGAEAPPAASLCAPCFLVRIMQRAVRLFGKERPAKPEA